MGAWTSEHVEICSTSRTPTERQERDGISRLRVALLRFSRSSEKRTRDMTQTI